METGTILVVQDDCLIRLTDGRPLEETKLRQLPPWRAVLIARVANKCNLYTDDDLSALVDRAREVGGDGTL